MQRHRRHSLRLVAAGLAFVGATGLAVSGQVIEQQVRDPRQGPTSGTGTLAGTLVTDESSPQPVRRASVSIMNSDGHNARTVYSDDGGRFSAANLPPGRYSVTAMRAGFVRASYGARRFDRPGTPITLAEGQRITDLVLKLPRGSVIAGTIADDTGQPAQGVNVRVMQYRMQNGERTLSPVIGGTGMASDTTDDRGAYRIFGLAAGEYVLSATPRNSGIGDIRQMTSADVQSAQRALQQSTPAGGVGVGRQTGPPPPDGIMVGYAPVFYPGTTLSASAATISVATGEERTGVDIALQLVRTARVEGQINTPEGVSPQSVQLFMMPNASAGSGMPGMINFNRVPPGPDGKFTYAGVAPGQYTITARAAGRGMAEAGPASVPGGGAGRGAGTQPLALWAMADVNVDGQNVSGVSLTLQPGMTVSGRVTVAAVGADPPADLSRARVTLAPAGNSGGISIGLPGASVDASGRFTFTGVTPGKYRVTGGLSSPEANWTLKSVTAKGKDALDFPFDVLPNENITDAVVTFTNQTQEISGALQDASGRPAPDFTIVLFPADRAYWTSARRIRTARPGTDGRFSLKGLPAGSYRLAALTDIAPGEANDPTFLEGIVAATLAITLRDGESKVQDLKIASSPTSGVQPTPPAAAPRHRD